jgi:L-asparagine transporter-like permease
MDTTMQYCSNDVRFQVLTAASMMIRVVFWVILLCKMIVDRRFREREKRRSKIILHGSITQKTTLNIILAAVRTLNLTWIPYS